MLRLPCRCGRRKMRPMRRSWRKAPKTHVLRRPAPAHVAVIARPRARHKWGSLSHGPSHKPRSHEQRGVGPNPTLLQSDIFPKPTTRGTNQVEQRARITSERLNLTDDQRHLVHPDETPHHHRLSSQVLDKDLELWCFGTFFTFSLVRSHCLMEA